MAAKIFDLRRDAQSKPEAASQSRLTPRLPSSALFLITMHASASDITAFLQKSYGGECALSASCGAPLLPVELAIAGRLQGALRLLGAARTPNKPEAN
eukprot:6192073-Pleurochrysis_carterae.AAC.1